jgi:hypothetical protein
MYFRQFFEPDQAAMSYLLGDPVSGQAVAIDPRPDPCQVLLLTALLAERQLDLCLILLTHTHVDRTTICLTSIRGHRWSSVEEGASLRGCVRLSMVSGCSWVRRSCR